MSPLAPSALDVGMTIVLLVSLALSFAAFFSMMRSKTLAGWRFLIWSMAVFLIPYVGAVAWFANSRRSLMAPETVRDVVADER